MFIPAVTALFFPRLFEPFDERPGSFGELAPLLLIDLAVNLLPDFATRFQAEVRGRGMLREFRFRDFGLLRLGRFFRRLAFRAVEFRL